MVLRENRDQSFFSNRGQLQIANLFGRKTKSNKAEIELVGIERNDLLGGIHFRQT